MIRARPRRRVPGLLAVGAAVVALSACGAGDPTALVVEDPWARPTPPNAVDGAVYFVVRNGSDVDDRLVGGASPWCGNVELHVTEWRDDVMAMYPATDAQLAIPAGEELRFEPATFHLMCVDLARPIVEGEPVEVTLSFEAAGDLRVTAAAEHR